MKNNNDVDDGVYDWNLLNGGKGWEVSMGQQPVPSLVPNVPATQPQDRRRDMERQRDVEWRRTSQPNPQVIPPSPALVRHGSKQRRVLNALTPGAGGATGQATPLSAAAQVNVPISTPQNRASYTGHPYANATPGMEYGNDEAYPNQPYGRASPMVSTVGAAPPAISNVRARGNEVGVSQGDDYHDQNGDLQEPKSSFWRVLTCRCG